MKKERALAFDLRDLRVIPIGPCVEEAGVQKVRTGNGAGAQFDVRAKRPPRGNDADRKSAADDVTRSKPPLVDILALQCRRGGPEAHLPCERNAPVPMKMAAKRPMTIAAGITDLLNPADIPTFWHRLGIHPHSVSGRA